MWFICQVNFGTDLHQVTYLITFYVEAKDSILDVLKAFFDIFREICVCGCYWESAARINLSQLCVCVAPSFTTSFVIFFCNPCKIYLCFAINDGSSSFGYWIRWNTALGTLLKPIHGSTSFTLFCTGLLLFREIRPFLILLSLNPLPFWRFFMKSLRSGTWILQVIILSHSKQQKLQYWLEKITNDFTNFIQFLTKKLCWDLYANSGIQMH